MKPSIKITLFVVFFLAVAGIGVALYYYNLKPANLKNSVADYKLTSLELQQAFEKDDAGATIKYVDKTIEVSGQVAAVFPGENNSLTVAILTKLGFPYIICTFQDTTGTTGPFVGEIVVVRGICSGTLIDVLMKDCVLISRKVY